MPWVPIHTSGLDYSFSVGDGDEAAVSMTDSVVTVDQTIATNTDWRIELTLEEAPLPVRLTMESYSSPFFGDDTYNWSGDEGPASQPNTGGESEFLPSPFEFDLYNDGGDPAFFGMAGSSEGETVCQVLVEVFIGSVPCFWQDAVGATTNCI